MAAGVGSTTVVLVRADGEVVARWRLGEASPVGLGLLGDLANLARAARRWGWTLVLVDPCPELLELVELAGLADVLLSTGGPSGGDARGATGRGARRGRRSRRDDPPPA